MLSQYSNKTPRCLTYDKSSSKLCVKGQNADHTKQLPWHLNASGIFKCSKFVCNIMLMNEQCSSVLIKCNPKDLINLIKFNGLFFKFKWLLFALHRKGGEKGIRRAGRGISVAKVGFEYRMTVPRTNSITESCTRKTFQNQTEKTCGLTEDKKRRKLPYNLNYGKQDQVHLFNLP